jgi:hypothetical protein
LGLGSRFSFVLRHDQRQRRDQVEAPQEAIAAVPADFEENLKMLEELYTRFVEILRTATLLMLQQRSARNHAGQQT